MSNLTTLSSQSITSFKPMNELEQKLNQAWRLDESLAVSTLLEAAKIPDHLSQQVQQLALKIATQLRNRKQSSGKSGIVQGLLQEFSLSSNEGIALMCLAEALLRIPDQETRDLLIKDKINQGNWKSHLGQSQLMFVNAATWGLIITDKLVKTPQEQTLSTAITSLIGKFGKGIIRKSVDTAMRIMGEQFVTGETIQQALQNAQRLQAQGFRYSYDMLGEAALTESDAERYFNDYVNAIHYIGESAKGLGIYQGAGISIKLSALHPRYQRAQIERVHQELYPKLLQLVELAKQYDIGLNIDAEETERLELSLGLLERLCFEPSLHGWNGIGFVIQAYQKRCYYLIDYIIDLAKRSQHRLMIRLVKGAYWDSEIKKAHVDGMNEFPVFTRKVYTDLSYIACAKKLLAAQDEVFPQFATHNAQTLATIYHLADPEHYHVGQYEFQCLHGMGEPLYEQVVGAKEAGKLGIPCRIYAPVGSHETLLAYLVRRLLENGANTSFVNRIADKSINIEDLVINPMDEIAEIAQKEQTIGLSHQGIAKPLDLYGQQRKNSAGYDLNNDQILQKLQAKVDESADHCFYATSLIAGQSIVCNPETSLIIRNPADHQHIVGYAQEADLNQVEQALQQAVLAQEDWSNRSALQRADCLLKAADLLEQNIESLMILLSRESGKTYLNAIAEVREAVDFLRYYATQARHFSDELQHALGSVLCISPWNFPLAIFLGQVSAALAVGNTVLAKPAEQTPLIAHEAIKLLHQAGIPEGAVQLVLGSGSVIGAALSQDERIQGIMFTGSTEVAKILQTTVATRIGRDGKTIPLIAETGGQNALFVDSSALVEQVVIDVVNSAFDSAGQRCSALRILYVQEDNYDIIIRMLKGAMQQLQVGNPAVLATDIGPVIDAESQHNITRHIQKMKDLGYPVHQLSHNPHDARLENGTFVLPTLIELPHLNELEREIFGPVLHVVKYKYGELDQILANVNAKGYGLTMGLHTRIDETIQRVTQQAHVGNLYINRNIVGAVVGVQPFGGEGLSGTGPKAGGALYLNRLTHDHHSRILQQPYAVEQRLTSPTTTYPLHQQFTQWVAQQLSITLPAVADANAVNTAYELKGPTGEKNTYHILARNQVLSLAHTLEQQLQQLNVILGIGSQVAILADSPFAQLVDKLPQTLQHVIHVYPSFADVVCDAIIHQGNQESLLKVQTLAAQHLANIAPITHLNDDETHIPLANLVHERAISVNTTAAGGNTSLMMLNEEVK